MHTILDLYLVLVLMLFTKDTNAQGCQCFRVESYTGLTQLQ